MRFGESTHALGDALTRAMRVEPGELGAVTPPPRVPVLEGTEGAAVALRPETPSALDHVLAKGRLRATIAMLGPAFVASVAYVDPGNFATNIQGGAKFGYLLLWVVLAGEPDGDADPVPLGEAGDRHRAQPSGERP